MSSQDNGPPIRVTAMPADGAQLMEGVKQLVENPMGLVV